MKICSKCKQPQPILKFYKRPDGRRASTCFDCDRQQYKKPGSWRALQPPPEPKYEEPFPPCRKCDNTSIRMTKITGRYFIVCDRCGTKSRGFNYLELALVDWKSDKRWEQRLGEDLLISRAAREYKEVADYLDKLTNFQNQL